MDIAETNRGEKRDETIKEADEMAAIMIDTYRKGESKRKTPICLHVYSDYLRRKAIMGKSGDFLPMMNRAVETEREYLACIGKEKDTGELLAAGKHMLGMELADIAFRNRDDAAFEEAIKCFDEASTFVPESGPQNPGFDILASKAEALRKRAEVTENEDAKKKYADESLAICDELLKTATPDFYRQKWARVRGTQAMALKIESDVLDATARKACLKRAIAAMEDRKAVLTAEFGADEYDNAYAWLASVQQHYNKL